MFEALSHQQLKQLLKTETYYWPHNLTLSRLVARSLIRRDTALVQYEIANRDSFWPGLLIPLSLQPSNTVLILSDRQRTRLLNIELPRLRDLQCSLPCWEGLRPPCGNQLWLLNINELLIAFDKGFLQNKHLIFLDSHLLGQSFSKAMSIQIHLDDWDKLRRAHPSSDVLLIEIYERLTKRLLVQSNYLPDQICRIDPNNLIILKDIINTLSPLPSPWSQFSKLDINDWVAWAEINPKTLSWVLNLQPLDPIQIIKRLFLDHPILFLLPSSQKTILLSQMASISCSINVNVSLGGPIIQEPISIFSPYSQPLPNTEIFAKYLLDKSRQLILGQTGLTIILLNDNLLRKQLTSQLAAEFGTRVVHELTAPEANGVICCTWRWWIDHLSLLPAPAQVIVGLLPLPSLEKPLVAARVDFLKREGKDWFREYLLPEALSLFPQALEPLRRNHGRLAILDGRLRSRSWGKHFLKILEPWTPLHTLLPE